jgi:ABC-type bacteriocin/lantibiotic exporter with double-glycine peptidase domain
MAAAPLHPPSPDAADSPPSTTGDAAADAPPPVSVVNLRFGHPGTAAPLLDGFCLDLPAGARCLLVGANGAGESG